MRKSKMNRINRIIRISVAVVAVFLLVFLAANEARPIAEDEPLLAVVEDNGFIGAADLPAPGGLVTVEPDLDGTVGELTTIITSAPPQEVPPQETRAEDNEDNQVSSDTVDAEPDAQGTFGDDRQEDAVADVTPGEEEGETDGQGIQADAGNTDQAQPMITVNNNNNNKNGATKIAYITIDDGPSRNITPGILDLLAQEGIKATFFVLPHSGVSDLYQRILDEGHEIGNHSYTHVYSRLYNANDVEPFREDVIRARDYIYDNFGYMTTTFRFPGGMMGRNSSIVAPRRAILEEIGYRYFDWNIDTGDANSRQTDKSAAALTNNVLRNTLGKERVIVLMHDTSDKRTTLEALPYIITGLREQGYVFDVLRNYDTPDPSPAIATTTSPG